MRRLVRTPGVPTVTRTSHRWARVVPSLLVLIVFLLLLRFDTPLLRGRLRVLPGHFEGYAEQVLIGLRDFAQPIPMIVACLIIAAYDRRRRRGIVSAILLAQLIAGVGYHAGKGLIGRYRPYAAVARAEDSSTLTTADTWIGWRPGNDAFETRSFPSGHSAAAFAFAGVLAWFYPRLGWLWWTLAAGCAASRYVEMFHWPSDCVAGGVLGYASARVALRVCRRGPQSAEAEEGRGVAAGR